MGDSQVIALCRHTLLAVVATGCLAFTLPAAHAWGPAGHRAVGAVADDLLDDGARSVVSQLLAHDLDKNEQPSHRQSLAEVSSWADEIRSTSANRPKWHFDDAPACGKIPAGKPWCEGGECASTKIEELRQVLGDTSRSERERNEALKWIVHLVGDLHQPMHTVTNTYLNEELDDDGNPTDRGGNDVHVALSGVKTRGARKLHGVWDTDFVAQAFHLGSSQVVPPAEVKKLVVRAKGLQDSATGGSPDAWVAESNALARTVAYDFDEFTCFEPINDIVVLNAAYVKRATQLVPKQIALGGARLARLINETLGKASH